MINWKLCFLLSFVCGSNGFYFDGQPRITASDGNLIVESAKDRNITFRLQGIGCLNVNDVNIFKIIEGASDPGGSSGNVLDRVRTVEDSIVDLRARDRSFGRRLSRMENSTRRNGPNSAMNPRLRRMQSRITTLETKVARILSALSEDNCLSNPCLNGGTCVDMYDDFHCNCPPNWEGKTCNSDVNECAMFAGTELGCQNGASCTNTPGSYRCSCSPGWQGLHCTKQNAGCASAGTDLCGHGTCISTSEPMGYKCICDQGWQTNGVSLDCSVDVDECSQMRPYCSKDPPVQCINLPGSFMCGNCPAGFNGNGHYCVDVNECDVNNGGCSTAPFVECINTKGSFRCGPCPAGWQGDGRFCMRSTPSGDGNTNVVTGACARQNVCHPLATCTETANGPLCFCPSGYLGSGFGPMGCLPGTALQHPCSTNPCLNGGTCTPNGTSFTCSCPVGTNPPLCAYAFNPCSPNPCQNGGSCVRLLGFNYRCNCSPSFTGNVCQNERSECGGVLNSLSGTIKYPLSDTYPHRTTCAWLIRTNLTQILNVTFTKFDLEMSTECRFDWLQIHDGRSSSSHMIGRFCGSSFPKGGNFVSTTNMLYLWFRSDNSSSHDGFELKWESIDPICGGTVEVFTHGIIASPGSPGNYPPNRDCEWQLSAPFGKRIQFQFFTMQLEAHENCQYDYVAIYSGSSTSGPLLQKFCNTSHPEPLTTPDNHVVVLFHSDEAESDAGFQIHYTVIEGIPGCGGVFTASEGEFGPPIQNGVYQKNMLCEYVIRMPAGSRVQIKFNSFELEESRDCEFDYIEIYEGTSDKDPKVNRYCGSAVPPPYTSLGNNLLIVFKSDWSAHFEGFRVKYEIVCGGLFENDTGVITSPFYPNPYEHSRSCYYEILAPLGKAVSLHFEDFELEDTAYPECDYDFVSVYDGFDVNSTEIGKYCGTSLPPDAISTLNVLLLLLQTDVSISGKGFKASYSFVDVKCGGVIKKLGHEIQPPKKSATEYEHNAECVWIIVAREGFLVQLTFYDFTLEDSTECSLDSVTLYEGTPRNGSKINSYCGTTPPPVIQSASNVLSMKFVSDSSVTAEGFRAQYVFIDSKTVCGGTYYAVSGNLRSPGWPNEYPTNKVCTWTLVAPTGQQIELLINSFELEERENCVFDYLELKNGGTLQSPLLGKYCGTTIPKIIRSYTNQLRIEFKSDSSRNFKGFDITWDSTISGCGGHINKLMRGSIHSPNYPNPYGINSQCDWRITVSKGSLVQLLFSDLEFEEHSDCYFDYIEIFDGRSSAAKSFGKYCSLAAVPSQILSTTNEVFVRMISDVNNQGRGFDLRFNSICTQEIHLHRGVIESPNFPNHYPDNLQCEWMVVAPVGNQIFVAFSQFEVEESTMEHVQTSDDCSFDYLEIIQKKSGDKEFEQKQTYCKTMPKEFTSIGDVVVFKFQTDSSFASSGFHLEFEVQGCGDIFTHPTGNFTSPNYPNVYPHGVTCEWSIVALYGYVIELTINDLDIETTHECIDKLEVSSEKNFSHPLSTFCHNFNKPVIMTSHGNELFVKLSTDFSFNGKGFSAFYTTKPIQCGGMFKVRSLSFTSPHYPQNYDHNLYCEWFLQVEENHRLSLSFDDFDVEEGCEHDSVKIYDGFDKTDNSLMETLCGNERTRKIYNSTDNKMLVVMQTDESMVSKGFSAKFKTACGKSIMINESGTIEMNSFYDIDSSNCNWTLIAPKSEQHVTVTISSLDVLIYDGTICNVKILIFDGLNAEAPLIREICVEGHPPPIMSNGNALTLSIVSQFASTNFKFIASYSTLDNTCGGKFSDLSGQVASPSYPKSYPNNVECVWELSASLGNRLILTVEKMDIEFSENCHEDYLEIRENDVSGKLIGVYCGKDVPSVFPQAERFWLKFRSSSDGVGGGFLAEYAYAKTIEIDGSSGTITSPLYPHVFSQYGNSFFYRITVRHGYYISIVSKELLLRSDGGIRIYDGYDENAPVEELPKSDSEKFVSSSNVVVITIGVDYLTVLSLKLEWNEVSEKRQKTINETQTTNCTENSIVYVSDGQNINITSPGFPYGYATNLNCTWILKPEEVGRHAVFLFDEIDLEDTVNCLGDYVKIYSSNDLSNYKLLNTTCQVTPNEILQLYGDPYLKVNFVSDYYTNRTGFSGIAKSACGSPMNGPSGIIKATTKDTNCEWSITVRRGRTIKFEFLNLAVPDAANGDCRSYVLLKNGESMESPFLGQGKFCGTTIPTVENTFSNRAYVAFKKHSLQTSMASFTLRYEEATYNCGGSIIFNGENSTIIHTPNYPNAPHPHIECVWTVIVPSGELIQVNFIERFDIKNSKSCEEEYVELRDGGTVNGNLIGQFCGQMPPTQYSSSNVLRIKYYTDTTMPMNGFKANISLAKCGGYYRYRSGVIQSSHYPGLGAYEKNSICEYHLIGRDGSSMNLTFIDLNLPSSDDCSTTDHLEIYSVLNSEEESSEPTKDEIGKYCGSGRLPPSILTSSNVLVRFVTMNGNNLYRGFRISFSFSMEKCGGEVTADTGFITSPGYPIGRPFRQYCEWRVTVPKGRRVKAEIVDFDLGFIPLTGSGRYYARVSFQQSLTFYNDFKYSSRIKKIGLNDTTEPVYSSDNKMLISLWIKNNAGHRGFKLEFSSDEPSICSGNFNSDEGTIESPKNVSTYYCEYGRDPSAPLVAEETNAGTLAIYIAESSVISSSVCLVISPIIVEYLPSQRQRVFTQKCNASSEFPPIASPFQQTKVITKKGGYYSQVSPYTISYKVNKCGKLIRDTQEVVIRNPQFPPNYGRVACAWQYSTVENAPIAISGNYGNLNCTNEYVYITASPFPSYMKKERFCGPSSLILSNYTIPRSAKSVFIEYHSANYNPNSTFDITIKANYSVCGGTLLAPIFEFSNPTNGSQYPNNIECIWDITTSIGYHIGVSFVNRFFLEDSVNCTKDYIELLDFIDNDWKILGRICGRSAPKQFNSTGTRMRLIFRTNENIAGEGFTVKWEENCGGVFSVTKESQTLTSPRYPNKYPRNLKCNYTLVAGKEDFINIDFDEFELEDTSRSCVYDNLTIYKYEEWSYPPNTPMLVGSYCWRGSLTHVRHKHKINLIFSSDPFVEGRGFSSRYYLDNCGGNVTNSSMIEVPRKESGKYADYLTCLWYVKAPANNKIVIRFEYFELEHNDHCYLDAVEVFQGLKTDADQRKAMLCGNLTQHAPVVNIKSNNAIVKFHSDGNVNNGGFSALILFSENCDKTIELNDKSPSYTLNQTSTSYPPHLDCHYVITVPDGYVVKIEFEHFHLAPCHNDTSCTCDYVAILDGSDTFAEAIDKNLCGHSLPQSVTSSGRSLFVRYVTDSVYSSSGFSANLKMEPVACGKTLIQLNSTNGEHTLKWPIDSSSYQPNSQCDWIIEVADMEHVEIHFEKFELEDADSSGQCSKDVLKLTDEDTNLYNSEGLGSQFIFTGGKSKVMQPFFYWGRSFPTAPHDYCGSGIPNDFVSNSKRVRVRFRSNESIQKSGFQFIARMSPVCHRNYTSLQGRIFVKILRDCETYITVPENNTISLYFGVFNVYLSDYSFQCTNETAPVRIYDNRQNRLLQYVCPGSLPNPIFANTSSLMIKTKRMETSWMDNNGAYDLIYLASDKGLGCGGQIFNYAGQFSSPMYPANDRNASDCRWDIAVPQNLVIAISFVVFDMGSSIHCSDNYFQIIETDYEGKETVARQYCGEDVPSAYKSNRNVLSIRFKKTSNFAGTGWNIQFMAVHQSAVAGSY